MFRRVKNMLFFHTFFGADVIVFIKTKDGKKVTFLKFQCSIKKNYRCCRPEVQA